MNEQEIKLLSVSNLSIEELNAIFCEQYDKRIKERLYEMHSGDILYCNIKFIEELGHPYELELGQSFGICKKGVVKVVNIHKTKKYPNKKWWQFWLKQEEYIDGYNLMIL